MMTVSKIAFRFAKAASLCALVALAAAPAQADAVSDFYSGKQIRMIIGFNVGGGYDIYARAIARHMEKYIPGKPRIIAQNMDGAGSRVAANWLYGVAPKDGLAIGTISQTAPSDQVLGESGVQFEADKFYWLGNAIMDNNITFVMSETGVTNIEQFKTHPGIVCGGTGASTPSAIYPRALNGLLGTKIKVIVGYPGGSDIQLALERGELNCRSGNSWTSTKATAQPLLAAKRLNVILQWGPEKDKDIAAYAGHDVPLVTELATNELDRQALEFLIAGVGIGRPLLAPPGVPMDRVTALRRAFDQTMDDPAFSEDAAKQKLDILPLSGEKVQEIVAGVVKTPQAAVTRVKQLIEAK